MADQVYKRVNISVSNSPQIAICASKYTFSGVLIKNKIFLSTKIIHFTDSSGSHFINFINRPSLHTLVNISASNPPKSEIYLSKYTFSGVLIINNIFLTH